MKAAIFDADGTLIDSMDAWDGIGRKYLKTLGIDADESVDKVIEIMSFADSCAYMIEKYGINKTVPEMIDGISKLVVNKYRFEIPLKAGVLNYLKKLKEDNVKICVLTASERGYITECFERLGIMQFLSFIMTCSEEGLDKNSPQVYDRATAKLGVAKDEVTVFEDAYNAIAAAKQGGYRVCAVYDNSAKLYEEQIKGCCDKYIKSFEELCK